MRPGVQRWVALFVSLTVMGLMLLFLIGGTAILDFFGVTLDSFRMAGGILLLLIGIQIVTRPGNATTTSLTIDGVSDIGEAESAYRRIVIPFALPLLVGPGVIANLMLCSSEAKRAASTSLSLGG
jgi:small neutral amino acid transporter SnatA (MarC family)